MSWTFGFQYGANSRILQPGDALADFERQGLDWGDDELAAIVADYFSMLDAEISRTPYVKSHHRAELMKAVLRSPGSIERKHQNISAVLVELGMPWIWGYKPLPNHQEALFQAIDRELTRRGRLNTFIADQPAMVPSPPDPNEVFVPVPEGAIRTRRAGLDRLVRKFDPVQRDFRNRQLGRAGEEFVLELERKRLAAGERTDLARKVRWVAMEDGDGAGFDVLSFEIGGKERLIEVKTTNGAARTPFFMTRNEMAVAGERAQHWHLYRLHLFAQQPRIFTLRPPLEGSVTMSPETWRCRREPDWQTQAMGSDSKVKGPSMHLVGTDLKLSASDLVGHLNCGHLIALDRQVAYGTLPKPQIYDPMLEVLQERGAQHEAAYIEHLRQAGHEIVVIDGRGIDEASIANTLAAMRSGAEVIVQAALSSVPFVGRADVLRRVDKPSDLGNWSYEVVDTKLSRETKGGTVLQLCLYSDLVCQLQGCMPEFAYVVVPHTDFEPEVFRLSAYLAYYRSVREQFIKSLGEGGPTYPEPVGHCDVCRWRRECDDRRHADDHLSLVAGISATQRNELTAQGITTMARLAALPLPLPWKPTRGAASSYDRIREQARIQVEGRTSGKMQHEVMAVEPGFGLCRLPEPSEGDIFFDLEGDPFVGHGGLEYLFGYASRDDDGQLQYVGEWCFSPADEKAAFERFVDFVIARRKIHPGLHVFHYAAYEPGALKRLMGRYAAREEEIDALLRGQVLVDLYAVVRHAVRASVESYSIKRLEPLYGFVRDVALQDANHALRRLQASLELGDGCNVDAADQAVVAGYNKDDCVSTWVLRDWLEGLRTEAVANGAEIPRPPLVPEEATEDITAWQARIDALVARLTNGIPVDPAERTEEQQALYVLAYILDWHRREKKATWWEFFRLSDLSAEELFDERGAISGLAFVDTVGGTAKNPIHRYSFPPQDAEFRGGEDLHSVGGVRLGKVVAVDLEHRLVDIRKRGDTAGFHPDAVFEHGDVDTKVMSESLVRIGDYVADHGITGPGPYKVARDLLLRVAPDVDGARLREDEEEIAVAACRLVGRLNGVLPIQGPPGAGKTYTGGRMILDLVRSGKRVGVTANSHKVIRNLLDSAIKEAGLVGFDLQCLHKVSEKTENVPHVSFTTNNAEALGGGFHVVAGTAWLWSRADAAGVVDVLFVDEAAQMSLANVLAISTAATSLVLLGDPRQLEQPMQGSHPEGTDVSALDHLLDGRQTIGSDEGLFLDQTWRLHPDICTFTSELYYEGRLRPRPGLENQAILLDGPFGGTGLRYVPVEHVGNQSSSPEEADRIREIVDQVLSVGARWRDRDGAERPLALDDILIIAPYNAQVFEIQERLPGARVGTVDKFQGQEAPMVIYSVASSSHADAPRGMEFLYSANRLNVATSRAKAMCIVVACPRIFEPECRTPRQMQLANGFCRYIELTKG